MNPSSTEEGAMEGSWRIYLKLEGVEESVKVVEGTGTLKVAQDAKVELERGTITDPW